MTWPFLFVAALYFVPAPVRIDVYPQMSNGAVRVRAIIAQHDDNRRLILKVVLHEIFDIRATRFEIAGAQRQRVFTPTNKCSCWDDLPPGEYQAEAVLTRITEGKEQTFRQQAPFRVIGVSAEP